MKEEKRNPEWICKPDSVPVLTGLRSFLWSPGRPGDQAAYPGVSPANAGIEPGRLSSPIWPCTGWGLPGRDVTAAPVRSYRTISPLPVSRRVIKPAGTIGGMISVALSVGSPRLPVRKHPALWCPDFPPAENRRRPHDPLRIIFISHKTVPA